MLKELQPAYDNNSHEYPVFIEKIIKNQYQCIKYNDKEERVERIICPLTSLINAFDVRSEVRLESLDLWFKVKSFDQTTVELGEGGNNFSLILNSVLLLSSMSTGLTPNTVAYKLRSGGKNFWFVLSDIVYLPMLNDGTRRSEILEPGMTVLSIMDNPLHGLIKGETYRILDIVKDPRSMFSGTIYIENTMTKEKITTYPKYLKTIS